MAESLLVSITLLLSLNVLNPRTHRNHQLTNTQKRVKEARTHNFLGPKVFRMVTNQLSKHSARVIVQNLANDRQDHSEHWQLSNGLSQVEENAWEEEEFLLCCFVLFCVVLLM